MEKRKRYLENEREREERWRGRSEGMSREWLYYLWEKEGFMEKSVECRVWFKE